MLRKEEKDGTNVVAELVEYVATALTIKIFWFVF